MSKKENYNKLNAFFDEEYDMLKSYVRSRISDAADRDAEDIVQDVALNLFSAVGSSSPINNVAGFVYRSVRNKIIDTMRTRKLSKSLEDETEYRLTEFMELIYGRSDNAYPEHIRRALVQTIATLKPHYKQIIVAIDIEGYSYKELAQETGIPVGTLMSRRHRALAILHRILKEKIHT